MSSADPTQPGARSKRPTSLGKRPLPADFAPSDRKPPAPSSGHETDPRPAAHPLSGKEMDPNYGPQPRNMIAHTVTRRVWLTVNGGHIMGLDEEKNVSVSLNLQTGTHKHSPGVRFTFKNGDNFHMGSVEFALEDVARGADKITWKLLDLRYHYSSRGGHEFAIPPRLDSEMSRTIRDQVICLAMRTNGISDRKGGLHQEDRLREDLWSSWEALFRGQNQACELKAWFVAEDENIEKHLLRPLRCMLSNRCGSLEGVRDSQGKSIMATSRFLNLSRQLQAPGTKQTKKETKTASTQTDKYDWVNDRFIPSEPEPVTERERKLDEIEQEASPELDTVSDGELEEGEIKEDD